MSGVVIYTDLDGTLLDHHTYSAEAATATLSKLRGLGIPVIPCTSKTVAETRPIAAQLRLDGPMIVENGAAVWIPKNWNLSRTEPSISEGEMWCHGFGIPRSVIRRQLAILSVEWGNRYQSLCDLSDKQVMSITGLDADSARLAKERQFCETLVWLGTPADRVAFAQQVRELDMRCVQGARFVHVLSSGGKAEAVSWLHRKISTERPGFEDALSISAGDAENDIDMLQLTDLALLVRSPVYEAPALNRAGGLIISDQFGPAGWSEGIETLLNRVKELRVSGRFLSKRHDHNAA
ncbi:MAG: HAD-IIB family hydrolase [Luminiphilus sp.]|nr:HAD-IIB family hydrolase [Luminiphilus sp.]MDG1683728.1 HAD-IIB family hydrolase [Luminiphilus sp.]